MATMGVDAILGPTVTPWLIRRCGTVRVIFAGATVGAAAYLPVPAHRYRPGRSGDAF